jgi:hypothetical protein
MPFCHLTKFKNGIEAFALISEDQPVQVLETDTSLIFRGSYGRVDLAVRIPTCSPQGVSHSRAEREADLAAGDATAIVALRDFAEVVSVLRGARSVHVRPSTVELLLTGDMGPVLNVHGQIHQVIQVPQSPDWSVRRSPVPAETGRVPVYLLGRMARAGLKISPNGSWSLTEGVWEIKDSQGLALRVATWPNPTATS